jgi:hypothetical protein
MVMESSKRKPGGQPGNKNAARKSFYASNMDEKDRRQYKEAAELTSIDQEIALLRLELKNAITDGSIDKLQIIIKATDSLNRMLRTLHKITDKRKENFINSMQRTIESMIVQGGVVANKALVEPRRIIDADPKTNQS